MSRQVYSGTMLNLAMILSAVFTMHANNLAQDLDISTTLGWQEVRTEVK